MTELDLDILFAYILRYKISWIRSAWSQNWSAAKTLATTLLKSGMSYSAINEGQSIVTSIIRNYIIVAQDGSISFQHTVCPDSKSFPQYETVIKELHSKLQKPVSITQNHDRPASPATDNRTDSLRDSTAQDYEETDNTLHSQSQQSQSSKHSRAVEPERSRKRLCLGDKTSRINTAPASNETNAIVDVDVARILTQLQSAGPSDNQSYTCNRQRFEEMSCEVTLRPVADGLADSRSRPPSVQQDSCIQPSSTPNISLPPTMIENAPTASLCGISEHLLRGPWYDQIPADAISHVSISLSQDRTSPTYTPCLNCQADTTCYHRQNETHSEESARSSQLAQTTNNYEHCRDFTQIPIEITADTCHLSIHQDETPNLEYPNINPQDYWPHLSHAEYPDINPGQYWIQSIATGTSTSSYPEIDPQPSWSNISSYINIPSIYPDIDPEGYWSQQLVA